MLKDELDSLLNHIPPESLQQMSAFGALSDEFIYQVLSLGDILTLKKGQPLFSKGDNAEKFFIVLEGRITIYDDSVDGRQIVRLSESGESLGFAAMIALRPRVLSSEASCKSTILRVSSNALAELYDFDLQQFAIFYMNLSRNMGRFLHYCLGKL